MYPNATVAQAIMFLSDDAAASGPNVVFLDSSVDVNFYNSTSGQLDPAFNAKVAVLAEANAALVQQGFIVRTGIERKNVE